jgi:hypothetical protein
MHNDRVINILDYMHRVQVEQLDKGIPAILSKQSSQEKMLDIQKQTNKEIQTLRYDLKTVMNERFHKIEHELE